MRITGKTGCKRCSGRGFIVMTMSDIHDERHVEPCRCLIAKVRKTVSKSDMDKYETKFDKVDGVRMMFFAEKTVQAESSDKSSDVSGKSSDAEQTENK